METNNTSPQAEDNKPLIEKITHNKFQIIFNFYVIQHLLNLVQR